MKKTIPLLSITLLSLLLFSCNKNSQKDCERNHTGSIMIHNDGTFMPSGTADFYLGSSKIASVAKGDMVTVDNIPAGVVILTVKNGTDTIYDDTFWPDTITQCQILHYYTSERYNPPSDKRLKKNITSLQDVLADISKLRIYSYEYQPAKGFSGFLPSGKHYGFMAQELKDVYPNFVQLNSNGYYTVNYQEMIPILAEGIREQQSQIDDLKKEVEELKGMIRTQQALAQQ